MDIDTALTIAAATINIALIVKVIVTLVDIRNILAKILADREQLAYERRKAAYVSRTVVEQ